VIPTMLLTPPEDRRWGIARQMGVTRAIAKLAPELTGDVPIDDRAALDRQIARYQAGGLTIAGLEGDQFDMSRIKLGLPGRDEDIARYRAMLANMGAAGIGLLCYNWMPLGWLRNRFDVEARGGATVTGYRHDADAEATCDPVIDAEALWANYRYFLSSVIDGVGGRGHGPPSRRPTTRIDRRCPADLHHGRGCRPCSRVISQSGTLPDLLPGHLQPGRARPAGTRATVGRGWTNSLRPCP
jgi:hypothetical protein